MSSFVTVSLGALLSSVFLQSCDATTQAPELQRYEMQSPTIQTVKQDILRAADEGVQDSDKALLLAVACQETELMTPDYPEGDGKTGDAYNFSLYKMNVGMLRSLPRYKDYGDAEILAVAQSLHEDTAVATGVFLELLDQHGQRDFLRYHRGGESGLNGTMNEALIKPYIDAVKDVQQYYLERPKELSPDETGDMCVRYGVLAI